MKQSIATECHSCSGTGVYRGFAEPPGVAVVCLNCSGTGARTLEYTPFTGLKRRDGVKTVQRSQGNLIVSGVGPQGGSITYEEFLRGKRP